MKMNTKIKIASSATRAPPPLTEVGRHILAEPNRGALEVLEVDHAARDDVQVHCDELDERARRRRARIAA